VKQIDLLAGAMNDAGGLQRFVDAQASSYAGALLEIAAGRKRSHWMWYIFPQLRGLGYSQNAQFYGIKGRQEAIEYLKHPVLGSRLVQISIALLPHVSVGAQAIFGNPDDLKLQSCMTLFSLVPGADPVFDQVLLQFFGGARDEKTIGLLSYSV
jgi:uncharacterized protein (DUF1810 family)